MVRLCRHFAWGFDGLGSSAGPLFGVYPLCGLFALDGVGVVAGLLVQVVEAVGHALVEPGRAWIGLGAQVVYVMVMLVVSVVVIGL